MGSPEQDPRSLSPAGPACRVSSVMAGMEWADPNGGTQLAAGDVVLLELLDAVEGKPLAVLSQTPDAALALAILIQQAAVRLINQQVKDDGTKHTARERMARINKAFKETS